MTTAWKSFRAQSPPATKPPPDEERAPDAARSLDSPEAFAEIFDRYFSEIHGYVARRLGTGVADDIAAETFLIAYRKRSRRQRADDGAQHSGAVSACS